MWNKYNILTLYRHSIIITYVLINTYVIIIYVNKEE